VRPKKLTEEVFKYLRTAGPTLSAFNAWVLLKGLETLKRVDARPPMLPAGRLAGSASQSGACFYPACLRIHSMNWPRLSRNPAAPSFLRSQGGREQAWTVVDNCQLLSITANLGDTKTTITHPPPPRTAAFPRKPGCRRHQRRPAAHRGRPRSGGRPAGRLERGLSLI
jgi:O-succinylhomoserine sulfhydrylase